MTTDPAPTFGALLRAFRLSAGLTQAALAERAGLSLRGVSNLERGERRLPYPHTVRQLARSLRLTSAERARLETAGRRPAGAAVSCAPEPHPRTNLPVQVTSFIGRQREMAEIARLLTSTRLLTLTGTGGCGKTRLALQVTAGLLDQYADGVWLAELAPLADPTLVGQTVAGALGLQETPGQSILSRLLAVLKAQRLLLVLDNCEHLIEACAHLADAVLRGCPSVTILATSREALGIAGEIAWRVPSLSLPAASATAAPSAPEGLAEYEAIRLFVERATAVQPHVTLTPEQASAVIQICRRLDGIPLALELAAARVAALSVAQIAARLDDRFRLLSGGSRTALRRQQTLQAAIDWSHDLLTDPERALLRRLAVFAGGWPLEAAEYIGGEAGTDEPASPPPVLPLDVLDLLLRLVGKSLVEAEARDGEARYRLLETVRHYAWARLREAGEEEWLRRRHLAWCLALAEQAERLHGPDPVVWLDRLEAEHDNLRAALAWCLADADGAEPGLRLAGALGWFWFVRDYLSEGRTWLERTLVHGGTGAARAVASGWAGLLAWRLGDYERATAWLEESLALGWALGDRRIIAYALGLLGHVATDRGDEPMARAHLDEAVAVARAAEDRVTLATALFHSWYLHDQPGELARVRAALEESLALWRAIGDRVYTTIVLSALGYVATLQGEWAVARALLEEGLALQRALGMTTFMARSLARLGWVARLQGAYAEARALYVASLTAGKDLGDRNALVHLLMRIAGLAAAEGQAERAARLFGAAAAVRVAIGSVVPPTSRAGYDQDVATARVALGEAAFDAAWAAGRALTLEEAVAEALAGDGVEPTAANPTSPPRTAPPLGLTAREAEVLRLVAEGATDAAIAAALSISVNTVNKHVASILAKTGAANRTAAAAALRRGLP